MTKDQNRKFKNCPESFDPAQINSCEGSYSKIARLTPHRYALPNHPIRSYQHFGGIVRPICFAAFRLMISSNFFGCSTGRSAGFAPLRILST